MKYLEADEIEETEDEAGDISSFPKPSNRISLALQKLSGEKLPFYLLSILDDLEGEIYSESFKSLVEKLPENLLEALMLIYESGDYDYCSAAIFTRARFENFPEYTYFRVISHPNNPVVTIFFYNDEDLYKCLDFDLMDLPNGEE